MSCGDIDSKIVSTKQIQACYVCIYVNNNQYTCTYQHEESKFIQVNFDIFMCELLAISLFTNGTLPPYII